MDIPLTCMKPMPDAWLWAERVLAMEEAQLADFVQGRVSLRPDQQQAVSHGMYRHRNGTRQHVWPSPLWAQTRWTR